MMYRQAKVMYENNFAGTLSETEEGYTFVYDKEYLTNENVKPVSLTLVLREEKYVSKTMFPFFDGLIPEGWLLDIATENWKLDPKDRMGLLLVVCKDCIGAVSILQVEGEDHE